MINSKHSPVFILLTLFFLVGGLNGYAQQPEPGKPLTRSSESEIDANGALVGRKAEEPQLQVLSKHPNIRSQFDAYSRNLRINLRNHLGLYTDDSDEWTSKLYVRVFGTGKDVYSGVDTRLNGELNAGYKFSLWIDVKLHDRFDENDFRVELIRMLLYDQMLNVYNGAPGQVETKEMQVPDWLVFGLEYSLRHKELGRPSYFYSGYLKNGQLINPKKVVKSYQAKGLTPLQLEVFRASAAILVDALCDQRGGRESMRALLGDLAKNPNADCLQLILKHFPAFRETNQGIDKWWALQLATMSQQQSFEFLSPEETQKQIAAAIKVNLAEYKRPVNKRKLFPAKTKGSKFFDRIKKRDSKTEPKSKPEPEMEVIPAFQGTIADYQSFIDHPDYSDIMSERLSALAGAKIQAFPIYRDVIERYTLLCFEITQGKKIDTKAVAKEFAEVDQIRNKIDTTLPKCQDYMNFFEATQSPKRSQAFENYIKFKDRTRNQESLKDPFSEYLKEVEKILDRPEQN